MNRRFTFHQNTHLCEMLFSFCFFFFIFCHEIHVKAQEYELYFYIKYRYTVALNIFKKFHSILNHSSIVSLSLSSSICKIQW